MMDRPRIIRWPRVAVSAAYLIACGFLIALCLRSYWWVDYYYGYISPTRCLAGCSIHGRLLMGVANGDASDTSWQARTHPIDSPDFTKLLKSLEGAWGFGTLRDDTRSQVIIPHWFLVIISGALAALPWIRWRFSLRTLLIVTALVALVLGFVVWMMR
jgi:hypothetical protein